MLGSLLTTLDAERSTVLDLQKMLVAIPAIGPESGGQGEKDKAEAIKAKLASFGFPAPFEMHAPDARVACGYRPSLCYKIPGADTSRTFWVIAHMDVVPAGERALWKTDPFALVEDGDLIYGRGVEDNHQGLVSGVLVGKALVEAKVTPPINYGLLLVADEENGSGFGLDYVLREHADLFAKGDLFVAPDHGVPEGDSIEVAEKSILWMKVTVEGKQCHASMPQDGCNSLRAASDFIVRLRRLYDLFPKTDALFMPHGSTFEPTKKEANVENVNTIPGRDVFYIDCRVLPAYDLREVVEAIEKIGAEIVTDYGVSLSTENVQYSQAAPVTSPEASIVKRLKAAIRETYGVEARAEGIGGGTVAAFLRNAGFETAVWSKLLGNPHQPNEHASIANTLGDAKVFTRVLMG